MASRTPDEVLAMQNRGPTVLVVTIVMLCLSTIFVSLRLISRAGIVKKISKDDYAIVVAWIIAFGFSFCACYGTQIGLGRHEENILPQNKDPLRRSEYVINVLYNPALMATKTSICLFYLTLAKNHQWFKYLTHATFAIVIIAGTALTLLNLFQCRPVDAAYKDPRPEDATCIDIVALYLSSAPVNIITDMALLVLPMPILTGMRLPRNEKIILVITFSFGGFVAVVDVIRIAYLESAALARLRNQTTNEQRNEYGDFSWIVSLSFMWSVVEVHVGMIVACVPGIKPLVARYLPGILGRIKSAADLQGNAFYGPGDALWANAAGKNRGSSSGAKSPVPPLSPIRVDPPPLAKASRDSDEEEPHSSQQIGFMDFLTTPDTAAQPPSSPTVPTSPTHRSTFSRDRSTSITVFDFVKMKNPRCMTKLTNRESLFPNILVTILFFLWGFAYGLLDTLNQQFQAVTHISQGQAIGLHSAYYGAYFIAPLTFGQFVFRRFGFKSTFMVGLLVYGIGTLVFWPSAVLASFPAFIISNFIIGLGVATLETAGNPFIALCGPPEYAEVRLNISQGIQAIGTVVSPVLAQKVLFKNVNSANSLVDVQWTYLGIALFDVILALVFHYLPLPEASDADLERIAQRRSAINHKTYPILPKILRTRLFITTITLAFAIFANFCYVGGQESVASYFQTYIREVAPFASKTPSDYQAIGHTVFAVGRFLTAVAGLYIKPRHLLLFLFAGAVAFSGCAISLTGNAGIASIILIMAFESGIFSLIFAIVLRGQGARTKMAAVLLTASTCGGAVVPGIMSPVKGSDGVRKGFAVVVAVFGAGMSMPILLETVKGAKRQVDPVADRRRGSILPTEKMPDLDQEEKDSKRWKGLRVLERVRGSKGKTRDSLAKERDDGAKPSEGASESSGGEKNSPSTQGEGNRKGKEVAVD